MLGVTGSGKTFTIANVIKNIGRPTLVLSHNKTLAAQLYTKSMGVMRRMCVPGTPKGRYKDVSDDRMAQIVAVLRLMRSDWRVSGAQTSRQVLTSGSCNFTVEIGASPRRDGFRTEEWKIMDHDAAIDFIRSCGCEPAFGRKSNE